MTRDELLKILRDNENTQDPEAGHSEADEALIKYINDSEITEAYNKLIKWYA